MARSRSVKNWSIYPVNVTIKRSLCSVNIIMKIPFLFNVMVKAPSIRLTITTILRAIVCRRATDPVLSNGNLKTSLFTFYFILIIISNLINSYYVLVLFFFFMYLYKYVYSSRTNWAGIVWYHEFKTACYLCILETKNPTQNGIKSFRLRFDPIATCISSADCVTVWFYNSSLNCR